MAISSSTSRQADGGGDRERLGRPGTRQAASTSASDQQASTIIYTIYCEFSLISKRINTILAGVELVTPREAARRLGVSYPTIKQWIYKGVVRTRPTAGGHHRIPDTEVERLLASSGRPLPRRAARRIAAPSSR